MLIDLDLLYTWGAVAKEYKKGEIIFEEEGIANFYYQIIDGCVKMFNTNDKGKEFTQGYFFNGQSFGEPPLFIDERYPSTAMAFHDTTIIKLSKDKLIRILDEYPSIQKQFLNLMARRIYSKAKTSKDIINQNPAFRIIAFFNTSKKNKEGEKELITYTRQEIANFTGLRVETVIRALSRMNTEKKIEIKNHKIYY
ncbi:Crp/Fnr family transcriptional regulator [Flavobacterium sp. DGU11]|uniref:Crp/Fnr family transcriptional regulator n=1 Tax=Flavobacterium arundinis TaxID=3139143 RepID=A0ABU9HVK3_9FLAO